MESQAPYRTLQPGEMLNWYRIERILGRGGFGVIYLATDTNLDHHVAIKEYIPSDVATRHGNSKLVEPLTEEHGDMFRWGMDRFIKEARNLVKFKHPNIVRVMSVFQENNTAYMVMEFEEGEDLRSYLRKPGANSEKSLRKLILPISKGLAEVHRHGFIHRDIKPANILVRKDGTPVLLDFGSARNASKFTQQSLTALVSVGYAPLEQYNSESDEQQGPWTDIYALGGTLYYALTNKDPVESTRRGAALFNGGKDPLVSAEYLGEGKFSPGFLRAIDWAMEFRIADRPQSLSDWIPALLSDEVLGGDGNTGPVSHLSAMGQSMGRGVDTKTMNELSDATVLSRERVSNRLNAPVSNGPAVESESSGKMVRGLALFALLLSGAALGLWFFTSEQKPGTPAVATTESEQQIAADAEQQAAAEKAAAEKALAEQEKQAAVALAEQKAADEAARVKAEEEKAAQEQAALEQAAAAEEEAKQKALAEEQAAAAKAAEQARLNAEREREEKRAAALAKRLAEEREERRLKQTISAAQNSLGVGDLSAAQAQLEVAESIDASDARVQTLAFAVQSALEEHNKPVSDADFDTVTRMFNALQLAIENKDAIALDRLAVSSQQSAIFKSLMKSFERIDVSITGIRVRNADKSIAGNLRIDAMVRENGDRATPSDKYLNRTITSRRVNGGWSKIDW